MWQNDIVNYDANNLSIEHIIIFQTKKFGYHPSRNVHNFPTLYSELCGNELFCYWIRNIVPLDVIGSSVIDIEFPLLDFHQGARVHIWLGNQTPVWTKRWNILLSVVISGKWDDYKF